MNIRGDLEVAKVMLRSELEAWRKRYPQKPMMMTEYGADTVAGIHEVNGGLFTEEFQCDYLRMSHKVFDSIDTFIGEHVWNFADFATSPSIRRVNGNKKGVFTRDRKPKIAAQELRRRWTRSRTSGTNGEVRIGIIRRWADCSARLFFARLHNDQ